jgi:hypothetical protein
VGSLLSSHCARYLSLRLQNFAKSGIVLTDGGFIAGNRPAAIEAAG